MSKLIPIFSKHPSWLEVKKILLTLNDEGFKAYLAGGCVRDALLNQVPKDFDIATEAQPEDIIRLFPNSDKQGKAFGVVAVYSKNSPPIEVATFRKDGPYKDGRHPEHVEFLSDKEDAFRRDLTVNALFYSLKQDQIIDYVEGLKDLESKVIRTVGEPEKRFEEDHLRILRAYRFSIQLNFKIETKTQKALLKMRAKLLNISRERVYEECFKTLKLGRYKASMLAFKELGLLEHFCPVLKGKLDWEKNEEFYFNFWSEAQSTTDKAWIWTQAFYPLLFPLEQVVLDQSPPVWTREFRQALRDSKLPTALIRGMHSLFFYSLCLLDIRPISLGKKLKILGSDYSSKVLILSRNYLKSKKLNTDIIDKIEKEFKSRIGKDGKLPSPLIRGEDLKKLGVPEDSRRGALLEKLYEFQLENRISDSKILLKKARDLAP